MRSGYSSKYNSNDVGREYSDGLRETINEYYRDLRHADNRRDRRLSRNDRVFLIAYES